MARRYGRGRCNGNSSCITCSVRPGPLAFNHERQCPLSFFRSARLHRENGANGRIKAPESVSFEAVRDVCATGATCAQESPWPVQSVRDGVLVAKWLLRSAIDAFANQTGVAWNVQESHVVALCATAHRPSAISAQSFRRPEGRRGTAEYRSFGLIIRDPVCQISLRRPAAYLCSKLAISV